MNQERGKDIADRMLSLGVNTLNLCKELSYSEFNRHISQQIFRSTTSAGANYEEARGAESKADFVHKLGVVLKELKESRYWLRLIEKAKINKSNLIIDILQESEELCAIIGKSISTTKKRNNY